MALRKILMEGDAVLNKTSRPVEVFDGRLHDLIDDLKETLTQANGAGLAAPQIGILRRVVIVMDEDEDEETMLELVNPQIITQEGEQLDYEGCLSVPNLYGEVKRPEKVTIRAQDRNGNAFEMTRESLVARCFCHEIEHLDGHLFTEHVVGRLYTREELESMDEEEQRSGGKKRGRGKRRR